MKVSPRLWQNTRLRKTMIIFVGEISEKIESSHNLNGILALKKQIDYVFWRWYFLKHDGLDGYSPYLLMEFYKKEEGWPKDGLFKPKITIESDNSGVNKINVTIDVDYIDFSQQNNSKNVTHQSIKDHINTNLKEWYQIRKYIQQSFRLADWFNFWHQVLLKAKTGRDDGIGSDIVLNDFIDTVRRIIPNYGFKEKELKEDSDDIDKIMQWMEFWQDFCFYWLWPLSGQMNIIAPWFIDRKSYNNDLAKILETGKIGPQMWASPPTAILITDFGLKYLKEYGD